MPETDVSPGTEASTPLVELFDSFLESRLAGPTTYSANLRIARDQWIVATSEFQNGNPNQ
jgi:hypothetical protein